MKHLDLFSGIGGFALAAQRVWGEQHEVISFCEIDPFCQKVLKKHWPDVPCCEDIRELNYEFIANATRQRPREEGGDCERQAEWAASGSEVSIDLLTGGFPCQPFSVAGQQRGTDDDRYLWPEMLRVVKEFRPRWIIGENVAGIINLALDEVCASLEVEGYEVQPVIIPACAVNAPHRRDRVWIIAHSNKWQGRSGTVTKPNEPKQLEYCTDSTGGGPPCHPVGVGLSGQPRGRSGQEFEDGYIRGEQVDADTEGQGLEGRNSTRPGWPPGTNRWRRPNASQWNPVFMRILRMREPRRSRQKRLMTRCGEALRY